VLAASLVMMMMMMTTIDAQYAEDFNAIELPTGYFLTRHMHLYHPVT